MAQTIKNLTDVSRALAKLNPGMTNAQALKVTRQVIALFTKGLVEMAPDSRERLALAGFGNFATKKMAARQTRHIKTGEMVDVPENTRISFHPADALRKACLSGEFDETLLAGAETPESPVEENEEEQDSAKKAPAKKASAKKAPAAPEAEVSPEDIPDLSEI